MSDEVRRVLVAGGGVAGLEAVLALKALAGDRLDIELLAPDRHFTYRPLGVAEPFAPGTVQRFPLAAIGADRGICVRRDALARVLIDERVVETQDAARIDYDALILALGAGAVEAVPGALTFRGAQDAARVRAVIDALADGSVRHVAFLAPAETTWTLPLYELALQTAAALRDDAPSAEFTLVTAEPSPLAPFGDAATDEVTALLDRHGVRVITGAHVQEVSDGRVRLAAGASFKIDRAIALPRLVGSRPRGVPCDADGFVLVDEYMRVTGVDGVFAVGDIAAQPVKQGGLATQQADVAATVIAAEAGAAVTADPYRPVLRGLMLVGGEVRFLRHDDEGEAESTNEPLWWPAVKVAGRYLAPYLAGHLDLAVAATR